ncbi:MAG: methionyl-tRNA formyltransferase [bacterium]
MRPNIIFFGTPDFSVSSLKALVENNFSPVLVVTKADKPSGRGRKLTASPIKQTAEELGLTVATPLKLDDNFLRTIKDLEPNLMVVVAYGKILPQALLDIPKQGTINVHPSLLPKYRGPSPIQETILQGDKETGVTIMLLDADMDHGPIIKQENVILTGTETAKELEQTLARLGAETLIKTLPLYLAGETKPVEQNHNKATYCKMLPKTVYAVDWHTDKGLDLERRIRAYNPVPGVMATIGGQQIKLLKAKVDDTNIAPGEIEVKDHCLFIGTADKTLEILELQPAGKKSMSARDWLNGRPF